MRIYLLGYMGCGKSTAGKNLAKKLVYDFVDLDNLIESRHKKSISEIFSELGEAAFRKIEQEVLHTTFSLENSVISTGGGAPCFFDNMEQINLHGFSIYIDMSPNALVSRLQGAKTERPLIASKTDDELLTFIEEALEKRTPFYKKAKAIVPGISLSAQSLSNAIEKQQ